MLASIAFQLEVTLTAIHHPYDMHAHALTLNSIVILRFFDDPTRYHVIESQDLHEGLDAEGCCMFA